MEISYIIEEMDLSPGEEERCCNRMDWSIPPALRVRRQLRERALPRRKSLLHDRGGQNRPGNFHFSIDVETLFRSLTTKIRNREEKEVRSDTCYRILLCHRFH